VQHSIDPAAGPACLRRAYRARTEACETRDLVAHPDAGRAANESLPEYYDCVHSCRMQRHNEQYHGALSSGSGVLQALVAFRGTKNESNELRLCRVGEKSLRFYCWPQPVLTLTYSVRNHPVVSALGGSQARLAFVTPNRVWTGPKRRIARAFHYSWDRSSFCKLLVSHGRSNDRAANGVGFKARVSLARGAQGVAVLWERRVAESGSGSRGTTSCEWGIGGCGGDAGGGADSRPWFHVYGGKPKGKYVGEPWGPQQKPPAATGESCAQPSADALRLTCSHAPAESGGAAAGRRQRPTSSEPVRLVPDDAAAPWGEGSRSCRSRYRTAVECPACGTPAGCVLDLHFSAEIALHGIAAF
jgi:hypothetical protein